jgi:branched-chain amino acid transport system permease protein
MLELLPLLFAALATLAPGATPQGRMYVSAVAGIAQEHATVAAPEGARVTVAEVAADSVMADQAAVVACAVVAATTPPPIDCTAPVPLKRAANGTWTAESRSPFGVAFVPASGTTATFRLVLDPALTKVVLPAAEPVAPAVTDTPVPIPDLVTDTAANVVLADDVAAAPIAPVVAAPEVRSAPARAVLPLPGNAATPPAALVLGLVGFTALALPNLRAKRAPVVRGSHAGSLGGWWAKAPVALPLLLLPLALSEASVYKLGLVLIVVVAAIGLHLLVNWAGELSLAHAPMIGLPAFVVAKVSADHGISPVVLLPLAIAVGVVAGAVVGLPAIRARGLQVALVTLAAGVAVDRFFFTKDWLVGDVSGAHVSQPTLGPVDLRTAKSMYPLLLVCVALAIAAAWAVYRSKVGRGLLWVKAQPDAAAAFGVPVANYRALAYVLAGAYAGFAGGLTAMWVQRLTPAAFPLSLSFTYLIIAALAGRGFVGGVVAAAAIVEGGRLFVASGDALITYAAPIGLIFTLTKQQAGLNGMGRQLKERIMKLALPARPLITAGVVALALGFAAIGLAWYHAGNTNQVWIQNQELVSGGIGGLAMVILGVGLVITDRLTELAKRLNA